ncbi:hypothetical protein L1987_18385 [Smallanthus sonchifolius]|uniref:Uncharacterized protein n=1 Tax=Smallanthus sonchifolius TaxID=185202 RepID=A0ACB9J1M7_9ASTR|nr:hypothetical protein L1987_18385 [Smallanthus sonchifolius]
MATLPLCHTIRSVSFPPRSHHNILQVEEELLNLKTWETSMSYVPNAETFCIGLTCLERLYTCVDNLLSSQQTQQALSHYQHNNLVDELLVRSIRLLDICGSIMDVVSQVKGNVCDIKSAQRRKKEDLNVDGSFLKKLKKNAKKAVTELKQINQIYCSKLLNHESHRFGDQTEIDKWSIVSKLIQKGTSGNRFHHKICVEALDFHVEGIENGLVSVFRRLISTRASLLNIQSN